MSERYEITPTPFLFHFCQVTSFFEKRSFRDIYMAYTSIAVNTYDSRKYNGKKAKATLLFFLDPNKKANALIPPVNKIHNMSALKS